MFNDISCGTKDNEEECLVNGRLVSLYARRLRKGQWSFIGPGSEKKWYSTKEDSPQGIWDKIAEAEMELSVESRSFVNRVNDQVRKRQKRISNVTENGEKTFYDLVSVYGCNDGISDIHGEEFPRHSNSIVHTTDLTLKKMFDKSAKLVGEKDEISNVDTIRWEKHSWKYLSLIGDETVINLQRAKVYVFSDSVLCFGKILENPESNEAWEQRLGWIITDESCRDYDGISGEPTEFEWNIFPGFNTLQLSEEVKSLLSRLGETPENFTGRILCMSMFNDISCGTKDNEEECLANARLVSLYARRIGKGQWSFIGLGFKKKWYSMKEDSPQGIWDKIAECLANVEVVSIYAKKIWKRTMVIHWS